MLVCDIVLSSGFQARLAAGGSAATSFCQQMSLSDYERQRRQCAQESLVQLLNAIVDDVNMSSKTKKKRIKQVRDLIVCSPAFPCRDNIRVCCLCTVNTLSTVLVFFLTRLTYQLDMY